MLALQASVDHALDVAGHERRLDHVRQSRHLRVAEHRLEHGEDTLGGRRVGSERANDLHRERPRRELLAVVRPEAEHVLGEFVDVLVVIGLAGALGQVSRQLPLECLDISPAPD